MSLAAIELALRAATIALLLVLAASLFRDFRRSTAGRLAIALAIGSAAHAAICAIGVPSAISPSHAPLIALSTGNVVVFWLFCRALFDDTFTLRWWHALIWLAVAAFSFVNCFWIAPAGNRATFHHRDQSDRARLHLSCSRADHRFLVCRPGRRSPPPAGFHCRCCLRSTAASMRFCSCWRCAATPPKSPTRPISPCSPASSPRSATR